MDKAENPKEKLNTCIGRQLARARNNLGRSQQEITASAGFSVSLLNKYENGETLPSVSGLLTVSEILDVPVDALLQDYDTDFLLYAIDSYLARINKQTGKDILDEVRGLLDAE